MSKTTALRVIYTSFSYFLFFFIYFFYISWASLHDYDVKIVNLTFYGERNKNKTIFFLNLDIVHRRQIKQN